VRVFAGADGPKFRERNHIVSTLDTFDLKILRILQQNNLTSQRDIARQVSLSPAAVHRRVHRLHEMGIVARDVAILAPERVGRPITLIVEVSVESERVEALTELKRVFAQAAEVQQCYYVTGDADFVLVVTTRDMIEYEKLTQRLFFGQKNVKHFRTSVAMDRIKATLEIPV
jgi:Lrp/AsnC family transcriptional regulator, leucine-responsive regulatory protein